MPELEVSADAFLQAIVSHPSCRLCGRAVVAVLAHPDDEVIGCGAQLSRLEGVSVVLVTDGAPRSLEEARRHGCASVDAYRELRAREWRCSLAAAGIGPAQSMALGIPDQRAALALREIASRLEGLLRARSAAIVLTHAYEGGHPDHDAVALAVHIAASACGAAVVEMPFYRQVEGRFAPQSFVPYDGTPAVELGLPADQSSLKARMLAAHRSQAARLSAFSLDRERFRRAPRYDFRQPPNRGRVLYEHCDWGLTIRQWLALAAAAIGESPRAGAAC